MPRSDFTFPCLSLPKALLISLGIVLVAALVLYAMGRTPMCPCPFKLWVGRGQPEQSQHFLDWYSYTHVLHGVIFYFLLTVILRGRLSVAARLVIATVIEGGWEIFENTPFIINRYRTATISHDYYGDTIVNSVGDILSMIVGFLIAARLPVWVTIFLFLASEVLLFVLLRDNLLLNIIMLIYPMEWIRQLQTGGG
jgi:Protein of unknown function (DUF2585)